MSTFLLDIKVHLENESCERKYSLKYETSNKFYKDKINFEDDKFYVLLDGVILNKKDLLIKYNFLSWKQLLLSLYKEKGESFHNLLKGSYYGFLFDKNKNKWIIFTDHIGSKPLYTFQSKTNICFSNNFVSLISYLRKNGYTISLNEKGIYLVLTYGFVFEDITVAREISRLKVGYAAIIFNNQLRLRKFYELTNNSNIKISEKDAIEEIDHRFRQSVALSFEKDCEYNYKHLAALSGGLDSRMTVWVANDLGYSGQFNYTFSQGKYLDETIAKDIASELKHEWLFKSLDNGIFLKDIDDVTMNTGGNVLYYGLAHGLSLYRVLDFNNFGITHSGQLGDVVIGTFYSSTNAQQKYKIGDGAYSQQLISRISDINFSEIYSNEEMFKIYIRGFYGANQGLLGIQRYSETYSPFYDIDFMNFCFNLPLELRFNHNLYKKWILHKYPLAAKYIWEREKVALDYSYWINFKGKRIPLKQVPQKILQKITGRNKGLDTPKHMNPLEYWYKTNSQLRENMDNYFTENIERLEGFPNLRLDCEELYRNYRGTEKNQVLSVLSCVKLLF